MLRNNDLFNGYLMDNYLFNGSEYNNKVAFDRNKDKYLKIVPESVKGSKFHLTINNSTSGEFTYLGR